MVLNCDGYDNDNDERGDINEYDDDDDDDDDWRDLVLSHSKP